MGNMNMVMNFRLDKGIAEELKIMSGGKRIISAIIRTCIINFPSRVKPEMVRLYAREVVNINNMPITDKIDEKLTRLSVKWHRSKATTYNSIIKYMLDNNLIDVDNLK